MNVLIIENHYFIVQMFHSVLQELEKSIENWKFQFLEARDYERGLALLHTITGSTQNIDLAFLDLNISNSVRNSHSEGMEIAIKIRSRFPEAKIMIMADYKNNYHINTTLRYIKPEGLMIMTDLDNQVLAPAITDVLFDPPFYSKSVLKSLKKSKGHNFLLDEWDERLLYELSQGCKMKDLPSILPLTLTAIEKRKRNLKFLFGIEENDNEILLAKAKEFGFI